jgi:hypothetical protein
MHACTYLCMYACMYVCKYIPYVCMHVSSIYRVLLVDRVDAIVVKKRMRQRVFVRRHLLTHTHTHVYITYNMYVCMFVCMYACMHACMYVWMDGCMPLPRRKKCAHTISLRPTCMYQGYGWKFVWGSMHSVPGAFGGRIP